MRIQDMIHRLCVIGQQPVGGCLLRTPREDRRQKFARAIDPGRTRQRNPASDTAVRVGAAAVFPGSPSPHNEAGGTQRVRGARASLQGGLFVQPLFPGPPSRAPVGVVTSHVAIDHAFDAVPEPSPPRDAVREASCAGRRAETGSESCLPVTNRGWATDPEPFVGVAGPGLGNVRADPGGRIRDRAA